MRLFSSILFLGCWLTRQWQMARGRYAKPSILVLPSPNVALGGNFYIQCGSQYYRATFDLFKGDAAEYVQSETSSSYTVEFFISEAKLEHGGMYWCRYCFDRICSHLSDRLYIIVTDSPKPKPSISVSPGEVIALEGNANIHCKIEEQQEVEFTLHIENASDTYESKKMGSGEVLFPIINAKESDGGVYRCSYCLRFESTQACSDYSDEVHIKVTANTFTSMEITIRLAVAVLVLLSLVLIVAEFMCGRQG